MSETKIGEFLSVDLLTEIRDKMGDCRIRRRCPGISVKHRAGGRVMVKSAPAEAADINSIMRRYVAHGQVFGPGHEARYGDFSGVSDYHDALNRVKAAQAEFESLPLEVRNRSENDPGKFLEMVYDPERQAELVELGLFPEQVPPVLKGGETPPEKGGDSPSPVEG